MKKPAEDVLNRYFKGKSTKAEAIVVIEWLGTTEGQKYYSTFLENRIQTLELYQTPNLGAEQQTMLRQINQKIDNDRPRQITAKRKIYRWTAVAAAVSIIVFAVLVFDNFLRSSDNFYSTEYGETKTLYLEDGTKIILNANSALRLDSDRTVYLEGEAFFYVKHLTDNSPFVVITSELDINVLGTEFNVNSRRKETAVILNSGSVQLQLHHESDTRLVSMLPGDLVTFSENNAAYSKQRVDPEILTSWKNNQLIFDHTPFTEIQVLLEDNFGLEVTVMDREILELEFTAVLPANDITLLLKLIEKSFNISITKTKNKVLMKKT